MTIDNFIEGTGLVPNPVSRLDLRTDDEIKAQLNTYRPVTSERNIWAYWDKGFDSMPPWRQRNVMDWVRRNGKTWTVRVLDWVEGSPNCISRYISSSNLPATIRERRMKGVHAAQHSSDFVRLAALYEHDGVYMDVGNILIRDLDDICWAALEDPTTPYQVGGMVDPDTWSMPSPFIAARKKDPFIYRCMGYKCLPKYGKAVMMPQGSIAIHSCGMPLIRLVIGPADTDWAQLNDYLALARVFMRVQRNVEPGPGGFDGPSYVRKHFFVLPVLEEMLRAWRMEGQGVAKLLELPLRHAHSSSMECETKDWATLQNLCTVSWSTPASTWGDLLRYGSVHYRQTRRVQPLTFPEDIGVTKAGMLDAIPA